MENNLSKTVWKYIESERAHSGSISFLGGISGQILFYGYMYKKFQTEEYLNSLYEIVEEGINLLKNHLTDDTSLDCSHGSGISGFLLVLDHLFKIGVLDQKLDDIIDEEVQLLITLSLEEDTDTENYDPLYGFIGKGIFFISQEKKDFAQTGLKKIIDVLYSSKIVDKKGNYTWVDIRNVDNLDKSKRTREVYDCGLAHGVAGIISFCCNAYPAIRNIDSIIVLKDIVLKATLWLLDQQFEGKKFMFPYAKFNDPEDPAIRPYNARLGWCYGDLAVAITLYKSSEVLKDKNLYDKAKKIALNAATIEFKDSGTVNDRGVVDPSFCHGTCGISYLFLTLYEIFREDILLIAYNDWKNFTIKNVKYNLQNSNLFSELSNGREDFSLLYGYAGIGLTALSYKDNKTLPWDDMLLL